MTPADIVPFNRHSSQAAVMPLEQRFAPGSFNELMEFSKVVAGSSLVPKSFRGKPQDVLAAVAAGAELGLTPMLSIRSIYIVDGMPTLKADLQVAVAKRHPSCVYFRCTESTDTSCTYETLRKGSPEPESLTFTMDDAKKAGLTHKNNWKNYPAAMLRARCSAGLGRMVYPDAGLAGVYDPDELGADTDFAPQARVEPQSTLDAAIPETVTAEIVPEGEITPAELVEGLDDPTQVGPTAKKAKAESIRVLTKKDMGNLWARAEAAGHTDKKSVMALIDEYLGGEDWRSVPFSKFDEIASFLAENAPVASDESEDDDADELFG